MLAIMTGEVFAAWISSVAVAAFGAYALAKRTIRKERQADKKAELDSDQSASDYWRSQYDRKVESDKKDLETIKAEIQDLYSKWRKSEEGHIQCLQDHAVAQGEIIGLRLQNTNQENRIKKLEAQLEKEGGL